MTMGLAMTVSESQRVFVDNGELSNKEKVKEIFRLAQKYLNACSLANDATWMMLVQSGTQSGRRSIKPDPTATKAFRIEMKLCEGVSIQEKVAWDIVKAMPDDAYISMFIWHCCKRQSNPRTQKRYTWADLLSLLSLHMYSPEWVKLGGHYTKKMVNQIEELATPILADQYGRITEAKRIDERNQERIKNETFSMDYH